MAIITWNGSVSTDWNTAKNWSSRVPRPTDKAVLNDGADVVESAPSADVSAIFVSQEATLTLDNGTVFTLDGPANSGNDGAINVSDGSTFAFAGNMANNGIIELEPFASGLTTTLAFTGNTTLSGYGFVYLDDNATSNRLISQGGTFTLTNQNFIEGSGTIGNGDGSLILNNSSLGVIGGLFNDNPLVIDTGTAVTNRGIIGAGDGGTIVIDDQVNNIGPGILLADESEGPDESGGTIELNCGSINGGVIYVEGGGGLFAVGGSSMPDTISNARIFTDDASGAGSQIAATSGTTLNLQNDFVVGPGLIFAYGSGSTITLAGTTINGALLRTFDGGVMETVAGTESVLINVALYDTDTVVTAVAGSQLELKGSIFNDGGTIDVDTVAASTALVIAGTVRLTSDAGVFGGSVTLDGPGDKIVSNGSPASLINMDNTISGAGTIGTGDGSLVLTNQLNGVIDANGFTALTIDTGAAVANAGPIEVSPDSELIIEDTINNSRTGQVNAAAQTAFDQSGGTIELLGGNIAGGTMTIGGGGGLFADGGPAEPDTISNAAIAVDDITSGPDTFVGQIAARFGTTLTLTNDMITGPGLIFAGGSDAGPSVIDFGGTTVNGAVLDTEGGVMQTVAGTESVLKNASLFDANTQLTVADGSQLELIGSIANNGGTINVDPAGDPTDLVIAGTVRLSGGGDVTLGGDGSGEIISNGNPATFMNIDNTISGSGTIGDGTLSFLNQGSGTVLADNNQFLELNGSVTNKGNFEATSGALLFFQGALTNTGTIMAQGGEVAGNTSTDIGGRIQIGGGGNFTLGAGTSSAAVTFTDVAGSLTLDNGGDFSGTVAGLTKGNAQGNSIDLVGVSFASLSAANESFTKGATSGVLDLGNSGAITLLGQYSASFTTGTAAKGYSGFVLNEDNSGLGGTLVTYITKAPGAPPAAT